MSGTPEWVRQAQIDRAWEMVARHQQRGDLAAAMTWLIEVKKLEAAK